MGKDDAVEEDRLHRGAPLSKRRKEGGWGLTSAGTETLRPRMVMAGLRRPSGRKRAFISSLAKGMLGLGPVGVPSTRLHAPTADSRSMME